MKEAALKVDLHDKIEHADINQLKEIYGLITNYFNSDKAIEEWDTLPAYQQKIINKAVEQADEGLGAPLKEVNERLRKKYGLNG